MPTIQEYAALSALVYRDARGAPNVNPLNPDWTQIDYKSDLTDSVVSNGLTAGAYMKGDEIVIAFKAAKRSRIIQFDIGDVSSGVKIVSRLQAN
jgi:hypothetical protein